MGDRSKCFIVGGGPSLIGFNFDFLKSVDTIAVNEAIRYLPEAKYFITMDYLYWTRFNPMGKFRTTCVFVVNEFESYIEDHAGYIKDTRNGMIYDLSLFNVIIKSQHKLGLGKSFDGFVHGSNSGFCALQLALLLGYKEIYLLGIDLISNSHGSHFHNSYVSDPKFQEKLDKYLVAFDKAFQLLPKLFPDVNVYSCSSISALNQFIPYKKVEDVL